eukprot:COSAG01_NODE_5539_length_4199_cov_2.221220_6_plen_227_part_00
MDDLDAQIQAVEARIARLRLPRANFSSSTDEEEEPPAMRSGSPRMINSPEAASFKCELNKYYDPASCGIGFHGDGERRRVIAVRLGVSAGTHDDADANRSPRVADVEEDEEEVQEPEPEPTVMAVPASWEKEQAHHYPRVIRRLIWAEWLDEREHWGMGEYDNVPPQWQVALRRRGKIRYASFVVMALQAWGVPGDYPTVISKQVMEQWWGRTKQVWPRSSRWWRP